MLLTHQRWILLITISGIYLPVTHAAMASADQTTFSFLKSSFVASLSAGPSWESAGETQTLNLTPDVIKTYNANKPTHSLPSGELFVGIRNTLSQQWEGQVGLALITTGNATLSGNIWDDADPAFNNYTYQYKVDRTAIAIKGKLLGQWNLPVIPWISAAIGVGFNRAHEFDNTPTIYEAVSTTNFSSNTTTTFTYTIGIGIQRQLDAHWQFGGGYEFSDWGKSELGSATGATNNQGLSLSHLYTNSILFNLTYLA